MKNFAAEFIKANDIHIIQIAIILLISVLAIISVNNINTYIAGIIETQNEIDIKNKELDIKKAAFDNYNQNKALENSLKNSILAIKKKINPYPIIHEDIIEIDEILTRNNITATEFKVGSVESFDYMLESQSEHSLYYAVINLTVYGNYYDVLTAYSEITGNERWYDIKSASMSSKEMQPDDIQLSIIFNIYFMEKTIPSSEKTEPFNIFKNDIPFNY